MPFPPLRVLGLVVCLTAGTAAAHEADPAPLPHRIERMTFRPLSADTGWWPSNSAIQVRFMLDAGSGATVDAPGHAHLQWGDSNGRILAVEGTPNQGKLTLNGGVEVQAYLRFDLELPFGVSLKWEGHVPGIPLWDYRFAGESLFTPYLLEGSQPDFAQTSDSITPTSLLQIPLTSAIIPIPGIGGDLDLKVGGNFTLYIAGRAVSFDAEAISKEGQGLPWNVPELPALTRSSVYEVETLQSFQLALQPAVVLRLGPLRWQLFSFTIPVDLPSRSELWASKPVPVNFALPRARLLWNDHPIAINERGEAFLDLGTFPAIDQRTHTLSIESTGLAALTGNARAEGDAAFVQVAQTAWSLAVGAAQGVELDWIPERTGWLQGVVRIESNDPRGPVTLHVKAYREAAPLPPTPEPDVSVPAKEEQEGAGTHFIREPRCGCTTGADAVAPMLLLLLGVLKRGTGFHRRSAGHRSPRKRTVL